MPKLTDSQLVILCAAAQRDGHAILPLPKSIKLNQGAAALVLKSLLRQGLATEKPASSEDEVWREAKDRRRMMLVVSDTGLKAIDGEPAGEPRKQQHAARNARPKKSNAKPTATSPKPRRGRSGPAVRPGTKQAMLIDLLRRKQGATIDEIGKATGWQAHSVRGAISGTLKKKLGLKITSTTEKDRGRAYRIVGTA